MDNQENQLILLRGILKNVKEQKCSLNIAEELITGLDFEKIKFKLLNEKFPLPKMENFTDSFSHSFLCTYYNSAIENQKDKEINIKVVNEKNNQ